MGEINANLSNILQRTLHLVEEMHHDIVTIEHAFCMLLENPLGKELVGATGANTQVLLESITNYLENHIPKGRALKELESPHQTPAFMRVFDQMVTHAKNANKTSVGIGDFFVALMHEEDCYCARLLNAQGIRIEDVMRIVVDFEECDSKEKAKDSQSQLEKYAKNLNQLAIEGKIDPLIGRDLEINQIAQVLCRRKKNNPILVGEAGVGKSAIIEGLALRIVEGNVPSKLLNSIIYAIDVSSVVAGTKYRGEFETRIKKILAEIEKDTNVIIFFDEIHMIVGAGQSNSGGMDFSNLLKPVLASGRLRCIGATTHHDYKNSFDKDKALARRFTQIKIEEPSHDECLQILQKIAPLYEKFHNVTYEQEAIKACVSLSSKYITEKHLPDKAIDLMDEAGAKVQLHEFIQNANTIKTTSKQIKKVSKRRKIITKHHIELLMSSITNIPKSTINADESMLLKNLESQLKKRIFSQDKAIEKIAEKIKINKAGLGELHRPIASFLFTGPSGVGKTELSKELAKILGIKFERIDMSEYAESHSISKLIGSPAGYVGYEEGGLLINRIRTYPHCVLLLDEIEKAHSDIYNILLQIMDSATLTDNQNNQADFKNVILIMTSNAGSKEGNAVGFFDTNDNRVSMAIKDTFSPEFRSRLDAIIPFGPLGITELQKIAQKYIDDLNITLQEKHIKLKLSTKAAHFIAKNSLNKALGAREIKKTIDSAIKLPLSNSMLFGTLRKGGIAHINVKNNELTFDIKVEQKQALT